VEGGRRADVHDGGRTKGEIYQTEKTEFSKDRGRARPRISRLGDKTGRKKTDEEEKRFLTIFLTRKKKLPS